MIVRTIDVNGDWLYGKGLNDYKSANLAVSQSIQTRLNCFVGDCFFDAAAGIDWFNLLGGKDQLSLNLAISSVILNTANVTGILQLSVQLDHQKRNLTVQYQVQTTYSVTQGTFVYDHGGVISTS